MSTHSVDVIRINKIEKHPNADKLEIVVIEGFTCCVSKGQFKVGDLAIYIEPDYVVPNLPEYAFLKGNLRIKSRRFRGEWSQGLLLPAKPGMNEGDNVMALLGITRYNPPEINTPGGKLLVGATAKVPDVLKNIKAYDLENWRKYKDRFSETETVYITEKLHGCNSRYCYLSGKMYAGSRNQWKKNPKLEGIDIWLEKLRIWLTAIFPSLNTKWRSKQGSSCTWWEVLENNPWIKEWCKANPGCILFGEIFGSVQDLKYGSKPGEVFFRAFDIFNTKTGNFLGAEDFTKALPQEHRVPLLYIGPYKEDLVKKLALMKKSTLADHIGEGIVIKPRSEKGSSKSRVALKLVSDLYLER
jgi:RNA ligase (TIGR02306 family)